ncbi:MAG: ATP-binding cassette domain-containing protein [Oscillospiraceae bacterium]|nr:ATP-binding cassette domain-containing protein [Oscillospiraceae bacterium]
MLKLTDIKKTYTVGDNTVNALNGVSVEFRKSEFVSILGQSGCGKTTLLNIIGGLDRYDSGELVINSKSTSSFEDSDWDAYRNHSIGFVFQSYNLIPHQTVLSNVELALTLSGVSKAERRKRAKEVLERVGLGDQLYKKPNQMSGGQMQRVAIARALINDPDILLADEPTGALDSETSVQIMDILKEISTDKLIVMVTHNPELAQEYSSRVIKLLDGKIISDSNPITDEERAESAPAEENQASSKKSRKKDRLKSMSFSTALSLSLNNLMTKKGRTLMTAFAGSIGIIGIALILSLSNGFQMYIDKVQEDTLSSYPLTIEKQSTNMTGMMEAMTGTAESVEEHDLDKVYSSTMMADMINTMMSEIKINDMAGIKSHIEANRDYIDEYTSDVQYVYDITLQIYSADTTEEIQAVNPNPFVDAMYSAMGYDMNSSASAYSSMMSMSTSTWNVWTEMLDNRELLETQYEVIAGEWPQNFDEVVIVVDERNEITDLTLYSLGLKETDVIPEYFQTLMAGGTIESEAVSFEYDELVGMEFKVILNTDYYCYDEEQGCWVDNRDDDDYMKQVIENALGIKVSGIIRPKPEASVTAMAGGSIAYTKELTEYIANAVNESEIAKQQKATPEIDVFTGAEFVAVDEDVTIDDVYAYIDAMSEEELAQMQEMFSSFYGDSFGSADINAVISSMSDDELLAMFAPQMAASVTVEEAKAFAATDDGKAALAQAIAASTGAEPDVTLVDAMSDEDLLSTYQQMVMSSLTADDVRSAIANMSEDELSALASSFNPASDAESIKELLSTIDEETLITMFEAELKKATTDNTYDGNLSVLGVVDLASPSYIWIYPKDFESKDKIETFIQDYNDSQTDEAKKIEYTDYIGVLLSSVTTIINTISYVLISFVAISLVVSSIMIGIITYISVLERTKEIGILRSIGASKKDISRVFNAETLIVGFVSGALGVIVTALLNIPINIIIEKLTDIPDVANLPIVAAIALVIISMVLTLIAGLIPSRVAAKKDPVEALRTE